jgi:hypothetical protein
LRKSCIDHWRDLWNRARNGSRFCRTRANVVVAGRREAEGAESVRLVEKTGAATACLIRRRSEKNIMATEKIRVGIIGANVRYGNMLRRTYIIEQFIKCLSSQSAEEVTLSCINRDRSEYLRAPKASKSRRIERARTDEKPKIG